MTLSVFALIRGAHAQDDMWVTVLGVLGRGKFKDSVKEWSGRLRARLHRYSLNGDQLSYSTDSEVRPEVFFA